MSPGVFPTAAGRCGQRTGGFAGQFESPLAGHVLKGFVEMVSTRGRVAVAAGLAMVVGMPAFAQLTTRATLANPDPGLARVGENARGAAWKLLAGYQVSHAFGLEAAYGDLGRYGYLSGMPGLSATGDVRMRAWSLAGTGNLPLGTQWSVTGKLGMGNNSADLLRFSNPAWAAAGAVGAGRSDLFLGLGVGYNAGRGFGLRFEYENYGVTGAATGGKSDHWAVNLRYSF
jgi:hypothetical protein